MTVRRKPSTIDEFIGAGGAEPVQERPIRLAFPVPEDERQGSVQPVKLRLAIGLLSQVDQLVQWRRPAPSRHQWILEAIYEKLDRDSNGLHATGAHE